MDASKLAGWVPISIGWRASGPFVDWCHLGEARFTEPFFTHSIERLLRNPATLVFRHETPLDVLANWPAAKEPGGFIFHMSRCGSTLTGRMLAALPRNIVISEAPPVDAILRANQRDPAVSDDRRIAWLRGLLGAFSRPGCRTFVKFDAWNTIDLPLIRRAFPVAPWIFLGRNPVEVLVSQQRMRGALVPGVVDIPLPGVDLATAMTMPPDEYSSRVLGRICEVAATALEDKGGTMIDYADLPGAFFSQIARAFGIVCTPDERAAILAVTQFDAKTPSLYYAPDTSGKQRDVTDAMRDAAARWIAPHYDRLLAIRARQLTAAPR